MCGKKTVLVKLGILTPTERAPRAAPSLGRVGGWDPTFPGGQAQRGGGLRRLGHETETRSRESEEADI